MSLQIIRNRLMELIHFESEGLNYFEPFSSDIEAIECDIDRNDITWCSLDPSDSDKPLTIVVDAVGVNGRRTDKVQGFYLFNENIKSIHTFEGDHELGENLEYCRFKEPIGGVLQYHEASGMLCYTEGFKEKLLDQMLCCI